MEFELEIHLPIKAKLLYDTWLSSDGHAEMTGGIAHISPVINEPFSAWDGYIRGKILMLRPNELIRLSWRTTEFADEQEDSVVNITLHSEAGGTRLHLHHSHLSAADEHYIKGWRDYYFNPMKTYFSRFT